EPGAGVDDRQSGGLLGLGLFREEDLTVPVAALSVGQQRRQQGGGRGGDRQAPPPANSAMADALRRAGLTDPGRGR
ncbi:hypothetical protein, partial [Streptomyces sp. NPDC051098]|uniref:hypothetical protein n=1 Tax=Streptomyces sp. NPDC051098 TaxID=3155411 RepID=UPI0034374861